MTAVRPILTAAETRAAEDRAIAAGETIESLMEKAGTAVAEAAWRFGGGRPALILCGPGNNGGDGYVAARVLKARGASVRVAALREPKSPAAIAARAGWEGPIEALADAEPAPVLVDALFGTGLARPLEAEICDPLARLVEAAHLALAVDLPSGLPSDTGALLAPVPRFDITLALGAFKPAHRLQPAAGRCGRVVLADIGLSAEVDWVELARPVLDPPGPQDHKYNRGFALVVGGGLAGAARLAAVAALRSGAGLIKLYGEGGGPDALICRPLSMVETDLADKRVNAVLIGPGLSPDAEGRRLLDAVFASGHAPVLDAGALRLTADAGVESLGDLCATPIITPHDGEFEHLFGRGEGSKIEHTIEAARRSGSVVVYKGPDTVIASPEGSVAVQAPGSNWLSTGGTGDVLAGIIVAMRARGLDAFAAACAGVWLHGEAARRAGPAFVADDLAHHLSAAIDSCR